MSKPEDTLNLFLLNRLNDVCTPDRVACYIKDNKLIAYVGGDDKVTFDPSTQVIGCQFVYAGGKRFRAKYINIDTLNKLYIKLTSKTEKVNPDAELKKDFRVTTRKVNQKVRNDIAKYEEALKANKR